MVYTLLEIDAEIPRIKKQNTQNIHALLGREELIHCVCDNKNWDGTVTNFEGRLMNS